MGIFNRIKNIIRANQNDKDPQEHSRNIFTIQVGDILNIGLTDYEVEGIIRLNDHGWKWVEYKLKDANRTVWLSVEEDDEVEVSLCEEVVATIQDPPKTLEYKGIKYYMQEGSDAIVEDYQGKINLTKGEPVDYFEYSDEDEEHILSIEIWNGEIEMSVGTWIEEYEIEIYPGS